MTGFGIRTLYRGVMFRSRLEAKWGIFFDLVGWPWCYEPEDLAGYIPDFVLTLEERLLVEIKPAYSVEQLRLFTSKIERSGWAGEALLLGVSILETDHTHPVVGLIGERVEIDGELEWQWGTARAFGCTNCGGISLLAEDGHWRCRRCGAGEGNEHLSDAREAIVGHWNEVMNRTQWKAAAE